MSGFADANLRGFGLVQRQRTFTAFEDLEARYEQRPSAWVEPIGDWGEGQVFLYEIPTRNEYNDTIGQGNLQHIGVLRARGLHPVSLLHLITGIGAYATAPLWLLFLLTGILIALQAQFIRPEYFPADFLLFPTWPAQDPVRAAYVFGGTMALLFIPKLLAYLTILGRSEIRRGFGGATRGLRSVLLETIVAGLMAPIMMLNQSLTVVTALAGRDVGWSVQHRADGALPRSEIARGYAWHTLFGLALAADAALGHRLRRLGLLRVPEEARPPPILVRANELSAVMALAVPDTDAASRLAHDEELVVMHAESLRPRPRPPQAR